LHNSNDLSGGSFGTPRRDDNEEKVEEEEEEVKNE
jgi:hypothetical protein